VPWLGAAALEERLSAAAAETAVQSIPPERRELFSGEEAIGRMPIEQAFHRLAGIEPRLLDIERITRSAEVDAGGSLPPDVDRCMRSLVGGAAERDDELLRSNLASSIAQQYLRVLAGDSRSGSPDIPYFENPRKMVSVTIPIRRPKHAPHGPA
jgi:hypothetical protein